MRILRVQLAFGFHAEARADARLFRHRAPDDALLTLFHAVPGGDDAARFAEAAACDVSLVDIGWASLAGRGTPAIRLGQVRRLLTGLPRLIGAARRWRPDVVDSSQQRWDCLVASLLAATLRRPHVIHLHYPIGPWLGPLILPRLRHCAQVVAPSDYIRRDALRHGVAEGRITVIRNTVPVAPAPAPGTREAVRRELGLPADALLVGIVARIEPWKGQPDTIAAFAQLAARHPAAHLLIVGDGGGRAACEAQACAAGLTDRIHFLGFRSDVPWLLTALDLFCHPSRSEAFGLAVAEATATGLPVVAYADGATPEVVADGETGLLAPVGDVDALAAALDRLLASPTERRRLGEAGRERIRADFAPEAAGPAYSRMLRRIIPAGSS
jgi:glycosyltransferase involved in cell wall biosynthesis